MKSIVELIPVGSKNAISREDLVARSGLSDRQMREQIARERVKTPILASESGGYYRPGPEDIDEVLRWKAREEARARSVFRALRGVRRWVNAYRQQTIFEGGGTSC